MSAHQLHHVIRLVQPESLPRLVQTQPFLFWISDCLGFGSAEIPIQPAGHGFATRQLVVGPIVGAKLRLPFPVHCLASVSWTCEWRAAFARRAPTHSPNRLNSESV